MHDRLCGDGKALAPARGIRCGGRNTGTKEESPRESRDEATNGEELMLAKKVVASPSVPSFSVTVSMGDADDLVEREDVVVMIVELYEFLFTLAIP
jgi:hypothetical protein